MQNHSSLPWRPTRKGVRFNWVISYLLIILLPMAAWGMMQTMSSQIIHQLTGTLYEDILQMAVERVETEMTLAKELAVSLAASPMVTQRVGNQAKEDGASAYRSMELMNAFLNQTKSMGTLARIVLYLRDAGRVVASDDCTSADTYYYIHYRGKLPIALSAWEKEMGKPYWYEFAQLPYANGQTALILRQSLPSAAIIRPESIQATLMLEFKPGVFQTLLQGLDVENGVGITIMDDARNLMLYQVPHDEANGPVFTLSATGKASGWNYTLSVPEHMYQDSMRPIRRMMPFTLAATILLGLGLIIFFVQRNYNPVHTLVQLIDTRVHPAREEGQPRNEYTFLQTSIDQLIDRHAVNQTRLSHQMEKLQSAYLINLLMGRVWSDDALQENFHLLGFSYISGAFSVIVLCGGEKPLPSLAALYGVLHIGDAADSHFYGQGILLRERAVFLLDCTDMEEETYREALAALRQYAAGGAITMACSRRHEGVQGIAEAYREASDCLAYALNANRAFAVAGEVPVRAPVFPSALSYQLSAAIRACALQEAMAVIGQLWQRNTADGQSDPTLERHLTAAILSTMLHADGPLDHIVTNCGLTAIWEAYARAGTRAEMQALLTDTAQRLCARKQSEVSAADHELRDQIIAYIDKHYQEPDLTVERICEVFGRSASSLSRLFKKHGENGLLTSIHDRRIAEVRTLMLESEGKITLQEAYTAVGYVNINTFMRQFKRVEGVTPGKFKEIVTAMHAFDEDARN